MKPKVTYIFLAIILALGLIVRIVRLDSIPPGLNRDEAAMGYNAYSLLTKGVDEHGVPWPISLESFGDWKLLPYPLLTTLPVLFLGLSETSTRLPSALSGTFSILLVFLIMKAIFKTEKHSNLLSLMGSMFFAFLPWNIYFSRAAYEANVSLTFFLAGLLFFLKSLTKPKMALFGAIFFVLSITTYYAAIFFVPIFLVGFILLFRPKDKWIIAVSAVFISFVFIIVLITLTGWKSRNTGIGILAQKYGIYKNVDQARNAFHDLPELPVKLIHNSNTFFVKEVVSRYLNFFTPQFLVENGGESTQHNAFDSGNLTFFDFIFLITGIIFLFKKPSKENYLMLFWLFLSPVIAALTKDGPQYTRSIFAAGVIPMISAYGLYRLFILNKIFYLILLIYPISQLFYLDRYFWHFPLNSAKSWNSSSKVMAKAVLQNEDKYSKIIFGEDDRSPYIYILFYKKADPQEFQKTARYYPVTFDGFRFIKSFDKFIFTKSINWGKLQEWATEKSFKRQKILFVGQREKIPDSFINEIGKIPNLRLVKKADQIDGSPGYFLIEASLPENINVSDLISFN